jgi:hypothetical protein
MLRAFFKKEQPRSSSADLQLKVKRARSLCVVDFGAVFIGVITLLRPRCHATKIAPRVCVCVCHNRRLVDSGDVPFLIFHSETSQPACTRATFSGRLGQASRKVAAAKQKPSCQTARRRPATLVAAERTSKPDRRWQNWPHLKTPKAMTGEKLLPHWVFSGHFWRIRCCPCAHELSLKSMGPPCREIAKRVAWQLANLIMRRLIVSNLRPRQWLTPRATCQINAIRSMNSQSDSVRRNVTCQGLPGHSDEL